MKPYLVIINHRTWVALLISFVATYVCFTYYISFDIDLTLISIAIIFPLVFTIRGSFRRREKALEHLSQFRSSLKTVHYFVMSNKELSEEQKKDIYSILLEISEEVLSHLRNDNYDTKQLDKIIHKVYHFIHAKEDVFSNRLRDKIFRFMNDLHESIENLHAIHIHRTPVSLRAYCKIFIYLFPLIYAPIIINNIGAENSQLITYFIILLTEYILISLYNIQDKLEYPFDDDGLDDIKLDTFKLDR